jgi:hypothetical protein
MREKLIHVYFGTNPLKVWKAVTEDLPLLKPGIENVCKELDSYFFSIFSQSFPGEKLLRVDISP